MSVLWIHIHLLMDPLVLEMVGSVSSVKPLLLRFVSVGSVLLITLAHQEPDALLAILKHQKEYELE